MGVPAFFKWLTFRYPKVVVEAIEDVKEGFDINNFLKENYDMDTGMPSIDNLYLDMNGIIHPCCHPQDRPQPSSEEEMFNGVFDYCDKLIRIVKPTKMMYFAIDGVAPRAKMNQQRSRRFRAALEARERKANEEELLKEWRKKGIKVPEGKEESFDSNVITPGTPFMYNLTKAIKFYITHRLNHDPLWKGLTVIFSDANVPGEGEHKILEYIRQQRTQETYNHNTKHCIYGADADLIMLSLITHEPHFYIIRESLNENSYKKCEQCGLNGHVRDDCNKLKNSMMNMETTDLINKIEFSMVKIHVVREYLELEFKNLKFPFAYDFERIIDDFVFLCFFVGNDFLPHLPSLKIREGAIDALLYLYKKIIVTLDGYLTEDGTINLERTEKLVEKLSLVEDEIFQIQLTQRNREQDRQKRFPRRNVENKVMQEFKEIKPKEVEIQNKEELPIYDDDLYGDIEKIIDRVEGGKPAQPNTNTNDEMIKKLSEDASTNFKSIVKEMMKSKNDKKLEQYTDMVKLGEIGWKERYYLDKFKIACDDHEFKQLVRQSYVEGICWVFAYYFKGCASWEWYYPFHYAPFASDLIDMREVNVNFNLGEPFQPFEQLLSVLPPYSSNALPECLRHLMHDPDSEICDFYPSDICLDINGQAFAWMGVNLIPFVEEDRIRRAVAKKAAVNMFLPIELERNRYGDTLIYFNTHVEGKDHVLHTHVAKKEYNISTNFMKGHIRHVDKSTYRESYRSPFDNLKLGAIPKNNVLNCTFANPEYLGHHSKILHGFKPPKRVVLEDTLDAYSRKVFKGQQMIDTVKRILGYKDEEDDVQHQFQREIFDRSYNNNRAIEYDPGSMDLLRKKRYQQTRDDFPNKHDETRRDNRNYSQHESRRNETTRPHHDRSRHQEYPNQYDNNRMQYNYSTSQRGEQRQVQHRNNFPPSNREDFFKHPQGQDKNPFTNNQREEIQSTRTKQTTIDPPSTQRQETKPKTDPKNYQSSKSYNRLQDLIVPRTQSSTQPKQEDKSTPDVNTFIDDLLKSYQTFTGKKQ